MRSAHLPLPASNSARKSARHSMAPRHRALRYEPLEQRELLAANLQITNVSFVDASNGLLVAPVVGQVVYLRAEWRTTDLTPADQYVVRFSIDGVPLDSATITGAAGVNLPYNWYRGGWYASPGLHNVSVTVDGANVVAETTEADNTFTTSFTPVAPTDLPSKFIWPLPSQQSLDWLMVNYNDVNPASPAFNDYRSGTYAYNGHNAFDATLPDFRDMDLGEPIYAAAAGTVTSVQDGKFDRQTVWNGQDANYVNIDHGNGWRSFYWHLARYTLTVAPGDVVQAGQLIGFVGSSGISSGAHVHFGVTYRGAIVETMYAPSTYYFNPLPYQQDATVRSMGSGITNYDYIGAGDLNERASHINVFPTFYAGSIYFYYWTSQQRVGDTWNVTWYRPNGTVESTSSGTYSAERRFWNNYWWLNRPWVANPGTWQVAYTVNGVELARESFQIVASELAVPEIRVHQAGEITLDERTTPYDFGTVSQGSPAPQQSWTIENHGLAPLTISNFALPSGFSIVGSAPTQIGAGNSATLTLQMLTDTPGYRFGAVELTTNDASEATFSFNVEGNVAGTPAVGTPVVTTNPKQTKYHAGNAAVVVDPLVTISDPNTSIWTSGNLNVRFASGWNAGDQLQVRHQGTGAGQIGVAGSDISYQGTSIGVISGTPSNLTVTFNSSATLAAIQALARNITYQNTLAAPAVSARYISFRLTDETGLSATAYKTIVPLNDPATISAIADRVITADSSTGPISFTLGSLDKVRTALVMSATSSNPSLVNAAGITLGGTLENRTINVTPLPGQTGTTTITVTVVDVNGGVSTRTFNVTATPNPFQVTQVIPTPTGAIVRFNRPVNPVDLNIVDSNPSLLGADDVTLVQNGTTGIRGSVVVSPDRLAAAFVAFSGALPDGNYTLSLRSAANGFKDASDNLLDGNADGVAGGDFSTNFVVTSTVRQISIPNVARGPGQPVDLPIASTGLPLALSDGAGVTQIAATLFYDPTMLQVTGAALPAGLPGGASINADTSVSGRVIVVVNSPTPLASGSLVFARLLATVPTNAPYTGKNLLDLAEVQLNGGAIAARDVDGIHVVAYFGDVSASGSYSSLDASRVARVAIGLESGFSTFQLLDPRIIADLSGNGLMSSTDTSRALQLGVGLLVPDVPPLPTGITVVAAGPDPRLWLPTDLEARAGETLRIPIQLDSVIDLTGNGMAAADVVLALDPAVFEFVGIERGALVGDADQWLFASQFDAATGLLQVGIAAADEPLEGIFADALAWLEVRVKDDAPLGTSSLNVLHQATSGRQTLVNEGNLLLIPTVSNDPFDPGVDGVITILPPQSMDVNADGRVSNLDALLVINRLHAESSPSGEIPVLGDSNQDQRLTALDVLRIINAVDEVHRRSVPASPVIAIGRGEAGGRSHVGGGDDLLHHAANLPYMSPEQANLPGGLEALIHMLALDADRPNHVRIATALRGT